MKETVYFTIISRTDRMMLELIDHYTERDKSWTRYLKGEKGRKFLLFCNPIYAEGKYFIRYAEMDYFETVKVKSNYELVNISQFILRTLERSEELDNE